MTKKREYSGACLLSVHGDMYPISTFSSFSSYRASRELDAFLSADLFLSMTNSPTASPTSPSPSAAPTPCKLTAGTTFTFNSYIMEEDLIYDDIYVHHQFSITVKYDCQGKAVNGGSVGPATVINLIDQSTTAGPIINTINKKGIASRLGRWRC
jgi:hypothetical protein